jgi:hypothetical protein
MDTSLLPEVAGNFARVANACHIDMIYFDGSEQLQGDHWYYNARLHRAFYAALENKDILIQASSTSHSSWHIIARSASADGHGDLKGYLDERSPGFGSMANDGMPLDIGWYYGYDPATTLDQYEYILGATIGYDSSMSYQVSPTAAARHPFTAPLLDLISRYEKLRLSGRVPEAMRARLRVDPAVAGTKAAALQRKEYHLEGNEGHEVFQRVVYEPWHEVATSGGQAESWTLKVNQGPSRVGLWFYVQPGPWLAPGSAVKALKTLDQPAVIDPWIEIAGRRIAWKGSLLAGQYLVLRPGERPTRHGPPLLEPEVSAEPGELPSLAAGEYSARFGCRGLPQRPVRVRIELQPPERYEIPAGKR